MGFIENGTIKNYFKHETDYFDVMTMSLEVKNNEYKKFKPLRH